MEGNKFMYEDGVERGNQHYNGERKEIRAEENLNKATIFAALEHVLDSIPVNAVYTVNTLVKLAGIEEKYTDQVRLLLRLLPTQAYDINKDEFIFSAGFINDIRAQTGKPDLKKTNLNASTGADNVRPNMILLENYLPAAKTIPEGSRIEEKKLAEIIRVISVAVSYINDKATSLNCANFSLVEFANQLGYGIKRQAEAIKVANLLLAPFLKPRQDSKSHKKDNNSPAEIVNLMVQLNDVGYILKFLTIKLNGYKIQLKRLSDPLENLEEGREEDKRTIPDMEKHKTVISILEYLINHDSLPLKDIPKITQHSVYLTRPLLEIITNVLKSAKLKIVHPNQKGRSEKTYFMTGKTIEVLSELKSHPENLSYLHPN